MSYVNTIITGLVVFPFVAFLITMPYALYQYKHHSSISKLRTLIIYSFVLYMLIAYFLVILPLPSRESTIGHTWQDHLNLMPFNQISIYFTKHGFSLKSLLGYFKSFSLWQLLFNVLLTVPFGMYMHYYFKKSFKETVLYTFLLSLFYELTQLSALYGIYPGPYRLADIEDLICNTLGGALGYLLTDLLIKYLPDRDAIDERCRVRGRQISGWRRFWAVFFDFLVFFVLYTVIYGLLGIALPSVWYIPFSFELIWTFFCIATAIEVLFNKGTTVGHGLCRMSIAAKDGSDVSIIQLIGRYLCLWLLTGLPMFFENWLVANRPDIAGKIPFLDLVCQAYFIYYFISVLWRKNKRKLLHEYLSKTTYMAVELPDDKK